MDMDRSTNNIYVSDNNNNCIRKVNVASKTVSTIAINIMSPMGIAFHSDLSSIFVASNKDSVLYKFAVSQKSSTPIDLASSASYIFAGAKGLIYNPLQQFICIYPYFNISFCNGKGSLVSRMGHCQLHDS